MRVSNPAVFTTVIGIDRVLRRSSRDTNLRLYPLDLAVDPREPHIHVAL